MPRGGDRRNAKSEAQRKVDGSRKRPWHKPQPAITVAVPDPPRPFTAAERGYWDYYAAELEGMKVLSRADQGVLANYCRALAQVDEIRECQMAEEYRRIMVSVVIDGAGNEKVRAESNPLDAQLRYWMQLARLCAGDLGLSPSSRTRVAAVQETKAADPFEAFQRAGIRAVK